MSGKRRVFISLFTRDELSLGDNRARLGSEAYHWAILIAPKGFQKSASEICDSFDVTNAAKVDPHQPGINLNPNGDWYYRHKHPVDPARSGRLLLLIMIGKVPNNVRMDAIATALQNIPLPSQFVAGQNCVWWTKQAIQQLQSMGLAEQFSVNRFEDDALAHADRALEELLRAGSQPKRYRIENYTSRPV